MKNVQGRHQIQCYVLNLIAHIAYRLLFIAYSFTIRQNKYDRNNVSSADE